MKLLTVQQIRELDRYTIEHEPVSSLELMERASRRFVQWFTQQFDKSQYVMIFCGPGNNGGDGLAVARMLKTKGYRIEVFTVQAFHPKEDFKTNLEKIKALQEVFEITTGRQIPWISGNEIVIDAIFGSGLNKPPQGVYADLIRNINRSGSTVVSLDIASGLFSDHHTDHEYIIEPAYTVTFQLPKLSHVLPEYAKYTGELTVVDIGLNREFIEKAESQTHYVTHPDVISLLRPRKRYSHKGNYGHALLACGSMGMIGAAILATRACVKSGAGLTTTLIPECGYYVLQAAIPEAMVITDENFEMITAFPDLEKYDVIGVGPGLQERPQTVAALSDLLERADQPMVIDASAINILATYPGMQQHIPRNSVLTPHPGEFKRLVGEWSNDYEKLNKARALAERLHCFIVLKGAYTSIITPSGSVYFNSTGNPGMAKGGSGDVLTGIITALIAQDYTPFEAALIGVYAHGYAADVAVTKTGVVSLTASDI